MDSLIILFPVSGVETWIFLPPLVAFIISFFTSMGGISGAFMLLPFQMNILNYTTPSVSGTNQLFNIIGIPSSIWQYMKEGRMVWPLAWVVIIGTLPGVILGAWIRIEFLSDPKFFKLFAGLVLCYIGLRLAKDILGHFLKQTSNPALKKSQVKDNFRVSETRVSFEQISFKFNNELFSFSVPVIFLLCLVVGIIGGIYGIGGGSIVAPFFVSFLGLPIHAVAGAALMGTFVTSIAGVAVYHILAYAYPAVCVAPDWPLGILFGVGGFFGMYLGARCQKYVPASIIKSILCFCVLFVAIKYILAFL